MKETALNDFLTSPLRKLVSIMPPQLICKLEFSRQSFEGFNERPVEFGFVFRCIQSLYPKKVLDVGTGTTALPSLIRNCGCLVTAIDNIKDYWSSGMSNRHYYVLNDDITAQNTRVEGKFDLITCVSVLEHIEKHDDAISNMFNLLNPDGHLILTFPYSESQFVKNVYDLVGSNAYGRNVPYTCQSFSRNELSRWIKNKGEIVEQEYWQFWDGDYWSIGNKLIPPFRTESSKRHQLSCVLIRKIPL